MLDDGSGQRGGGMKPRDELANGGRARPFVFARPGVACVVYLTAGGRFTLDLSADAGTFSARWFNSRTGKFNEEFKVGGGGPRRSNAPGVNG
jgi:hypothetical protein